MMVPTAGDTLQPQKLYTQETKHQESTMRKRDRLPKTTVGTMMKPRKCSRGEGGIRLTIRSLLIGLLLVSVSFAQTVSPAGITIPDSSPVCNGGMDTEEACITLPPGSIVDKVDVFFLFDDTGSFAEEAPGVIGIFSSLVTALETALPAVSFGFGVGRFEDYGGPGRFFGSGSVPSRPFLLNQPIITAADAGGASARDALITTALGNTAPGLGGDAPEAAIAEGLYQVATGVGFDGNGDSITTGLGGLQPACSLVAQIGADGSGDVPAFSSCAALPASGTVGGAGFRTGALRLVILATDVCSIAAFDSTLGIPPSITGTGSTEPTSAYQCSPSLGFARFGFVSDSLTAAGNTITDAVVPLGAGTVPSTIAALNAAGIRVMGMAPNGAPTADTFASGGPNGFLSALARTTGAVDGGGVPLVFDIGGGGDPLKDAIVAAIVTSSTSPIDINLMTAATPPAGLSISFTPAVVLDVAPGGEACFDVKFTGTGSPMGVFDLNFKDDASGAILGSIPGTIDCDQAIEVSVDIKPTSCPNPLNCRGGGVVPVAILGTGAFDVTTIDPESVFLHGVAAERWALEDVATPHFRSSDDCNDCTTDGADGLVDLTLKFDKKALLEQLGTQDNRACLVIDLLGNLKDDFGGTPIEGSDVMRFQCK